MIKVGFNSFPLNSGHNTRGIGYYTRNLLSELKKNLELEVLEFDNIKNIPRVDVVHYPFFDLFARTLHISPLFPTIVTIHDVTPLIFPNSYPPGLKGTINNFFQKLSLKKVSAIITDSDSSKKDIAKYLDFDSSKIQVISLAASTDFKKITNLEELDQIREKYQLPQKFALYTGNVNWNKNILNLCQACIESGLDLVLVGDSFLKKENLDHPEMKDFAQFLNKFSQHPKIHTLGFVPNEDLVGVVNLAHVVMLPSYYEGFGLPILEAQACQVPVITSNISSMPEVLGDGGILVDPKNITELVHAIGEVENQDKRAELISKGIINQSRFSWSKTAAQTFEVYKSVIRNVK